jgi:hypothetical protein
MPKTGSFGKQSQAGSSPKETAHAGASQLSHQTFEQIKAQNINFPILQHFLLSSRATAGSTCSTPQEERKAPVPAPQTVPAQTDQGSQQQQQDQRNSGDQPKADNREVGRDWRMRPGEGDRMGRDDREIGREWRMHRTARQVATVTWTAAGTANEGIATGTGWSGIGTAEATTMTIARAVA